jgi:hypothetical protein
MFHQYLLSPLGMGSDSEKRIQHIVYHKAGEKTEWMWMRGGRVKI